MSGELSNISEPLFREQSSHFKVWRDKIQWFVRNCQPKCQTRFFVGSDWNAEKVCLLVGRSCLQRTRKKLLWLFKLFFLSSIVPCLLLAPSKSLEFSKSLIILPLLIFKTSHFQYYNEPATSCSSCHFHLFAAVSCTCLVAVFQLVVRGSWKRTGETFARQSSPFWDVNGRGKVLGGSKKIHGRPQPPGFLSSDCKYLDGKIEDWMGEKIVNLSLQIF